MSSTKVALTSANSEFQDGVRAPCPACASPEWVDIGPSRTNGYRLCECRNCHLLYSNPMTAADSAWYSSSWLYGMRESHVGVPGGDYKVPWNFSKALDELQMGSRARLLDVGCAEGYFLYLAQKAGYEVTGLDFNPVSLEVARRVLGISTVYQYSVEELCDRFPGTLFDVITIFEVLEHTADPYQTVRSINKLLKPGGKLFISVPGGRRWPRFFHPEVDAPPHHLTLWTEEALKELLERAGFRVLSVQAKPLEAEDIGFHLKLRLYGLFRKLRGMEVDGKEEERAESSLVRQIVPAKRRMETFRKLAKAALQPFCWALALNPKAGGFTLFAHCEKE
jgi:SAM-dependent methyltransferase